MLLLMSTVASGQKSQICFSIDDMPVVSYGINDSNYQKMIFNSIMSSLVKNKIPAIGFVNERKIHKEADGGRYQKELLKNWIKSGLELGNHTYSHPDFNNVSCKEYTSDILKGEPILKNRGLTVGLSLRARKVSSSMETLCHLTILNKADIINFVS